MHCMLYREALASKTLSSERIKVLEQVITLINIVALLAHTYSDPFVEIWIRITATFRNTLRRDGC